MAIKPKQILDTAVGLGKSAVSAVVKPLRRGDGHETSGSPTTVGAAKPGAPGGHKSGTAKTGRSAASKSTAEAAKRGATGSGKAKTKTAPKAKGSATPKDAVETGKAAAEKDKTSTPRKRATGRRTTASEAAATSGEEVADAASRKSDE